MTKQFVFSLSMLVGALAAASQSATAAPLCKNACNGHIDCQYPLRKSDIAKGFGAALFQRNDAGGTFLRAHSRTGRLEADEHDQRPGAIVAVRLCRQKIDADDLSTFSACLPFEVIRYKGVTACP